MKILIAIDVSEFSQAVLQNLAARPWPPDTEMRVLNVVEPPSVLMGREMSGPDPEFEMVWMALRERAKDLVAKAAEKLHGAALNVTTTLEEGDPKSVILDVAKDWHADMIVLGSHGRSGFTRFLIGSVSESVARHAHCSVEIIRTRV